MVRRKAVPVSKLMKLYELTEMPVWYSKAGRLDLIKKCYKDLTRLVLMEIRPYLSPELSEEVEDYLDHIKGDIQLAEEIGTKTPLIMTLADFYEKIILDIAGYKKEKLPEDVADEVSARLEEYRHDIVNERAEYFPDIIEGITYLFLVIFNRYVKYPHPRIAEYALELDTNLLVSDVEWSAYWFARFDTRVRAVFLWE